MNFWEEMEKEEVQWPTLFKEISAKHLCSDPGQPINSQPFAYAIKKKRLSTVEYLPILGI